MIKYNNEFLIKVVVNDFYKSQWIEYLTEIKFLGIVWRKEGYYSTFLSRSRIHEAPKNHTLIDGVVYENPEVILYYPDNIKKRIVCHSLKEAERYAMDITEIKNWI